MFVLRMDVRFAQVWRLQCILRAKIEVAPHHSYPLVVVQSLKNSRTLSDDEIEDLTTLLERMVSIQTESPEGRGYKEFVDFVESWVNSHLQHYDIEIIEVPEECYSNLPDLKSKFVGPRLNLLLRAQDRSRKVIHVNGHFDVVNAGESELWTVTKPFQPISKDGRLFGRGTSDMKGSIACLLKSLEIIEKNGLSPQFVVDVSLTCDEEYGEYTGLRYLVDATKAGQKYLNADLLLSLDGGIDTIGIGAAGFISYKITARGKTVHSSVPHRGVNAIFAMVPMIQAIKELGLKIESKWSTYPAPPKSGITKVKPCLNVTLIQGGHAQNAIPEICSIEGDRRVIPDENFDEAVLELANTIIDTKLRHNIDLEFDVRPGASRPFATSPENLFLKLYKGIAEDVMQRELPIAVGFGSTDVSRVKTDANIDVISHGAADELSRAHGYDESVSVENLRYLTETLLLFFTKNSRANEHRDVRP
jgi:succinyl-diaminopimelate desuccinylase